MLASELIKGYRRQFLSLRCMVKVDLTKAHDSIEWHFLRNMMNELGFPSLFLRWVMACISSVSYTILTNGFPSPKYPNMKGLRQGDPISPFLFAFAMEYWSRKLKMMSRDGEFSFHPKCKRNNIVSLMFVDDFLVFCKADQASVLAVKQQLVNISESSSLCPNMEKSEVYFGGIGELEQ